MTTTKTAAPKRRRRELLTYDDIARMTGLREQSLRVYQRDAKARREAGEPRRTDMPAPAKRRGATAGGHGVPLFDGEEIRTWLRQTGRPFIKIRPE